MTKECVAQREHLKFKSLVKNEGGKKSVEFCSISISSWGHVGTCKYLLASQSLKKWLLSPT